MPIIAVRLLISAVLAHKSWSIKDGTNIWYGYFLLCVTEFFRKQKRWGYSNIIILQ